MHVSLRRGALPDIHWGAVIAGILCALAIHITLGLIGIGLGFAASPADSTAVGAGAVVWSMLTPFVATLVGAYIAVRSARAVNPASAQLHGVLVWAAGLICGALFLMSTMLGGALGAGAAAGERARPGARVEGPLNPEELAGRAGAASGAAGLGALFGLVGGIVGATAGRKSLIGEDETRRDRGFGERETLPPFEREEAYEGTVVPESKVPPAPPRSGPTPH